MRRTGLLLTVILATVLLFGVAAVPFQAITNFSNITLSGDLVVGDDVTVGGDLNANTQINAKQSTQVLTADAMLMVTGSYLPISATAAIGTASIQTASVTPGTVIHVINVGSQTITFTDTGTLALPGNVALGTSDPLVAQFDGTNWVALGTSNN